MVMLAASVAPSAAACLGAEAERDMGCCAREAGCDRLAFRRACCPCSSPSPATAPVPGATLSGHDPLAAPAAALVDLPRLPARLSLAAGAARERGLLRLAHDPPWLLHSAFLI
jgi:hypothetical protein